jgi:GT2 family glycosyltransferase
MSVVDCFSEHQDIELIVINDVGRPIELGEWAKLKRVTVVETQSDERAVARNTGAAIAKGKYLHFLDDDDWVLPGFFTQLKQEALKHPDRGMVYGASQLIDRKGNPIIQLHHHLNGNCFIQVMAGEWIPLQASLIESGTFFNLGGFNPLVIGIEDVDLARRYALSGEFHYLDEVVACIEMGLEKSTTDYAAAAQKGRAARESVLDEVMALRRMWNSADSSYWVGRISRAYFSSALWNLQNRSLLRALGRFLTGLLSMVMSIKHFFIADFWSALLHEHESRVFLDGFTKVGRDVRRRQEEKLFPG